MTQFLNKIAAMEKVCDLASALKICRNFILVFNPIVSIPNKSVNVFFFNSCHGAQAWPISVLFRHMCVLSVCLRTPRLSLGHPGSLTSVHDLKCMRTQTAPLFNAPLVWLFLDP